MKDIITHAAADRFLQDKEALKLLEAEHEIFQSYALTMAVKKKVSASDSSIAIKQVNPADAEPKGPLHLFIQVPPQALATARAKAAYITFSALKTEASAAGFKVSDTK